MRFPDALESLETQTLYLFGCKAFMVGTPYPHLSGKILLLQSPLGQTKNLVSI